MSWLCQKHNRTLEDGELCSLGPRLHGPDEPALAPTFEEPRKAKRRR